MPDFAAYPSLLLAIFHRHTIPGNHNILISPLHESGPICGALFTIGDPIDVIGDNHVVGPDALRADESSRRGPLDLRAFAVPDAGANLEPADFPRPTSRAERWGGLALWDRLRDQESDKPKHRAGEIWPLERDLQPIHRKMATARRADRADADPPLEQNQVERNRLGRSVNLVSLLYLYESRADLRD